MTAATDMTFASSTNITSAKTKADTAAAMSDAILFSRAENEQAEKASEHSDAKDILSYSLIEATVPNISFSSFRLIPSEKVWLIIAHKHCSVNR